MSLRGYKILKLIQDSSNLLKVAKLALESLKGL